MRAVTPTRATGSSAAALRVLSISMGVFFLFMGLDKVDWLADSSLLTTQLRGWHETAPAPSRWYLETVAMPGAPVFARLVLVGELRLSVWRSSRDSGFGSPPSPACSWS